MFQLCLMEPQGWGKLIPAAQKNWKYTVGVAVCDDNGHPPQPSWKRHLRPQDEVIGDNGGGKVERLNGLVESVQFFEQRVVSRAVKALVEVLQQVRFESRMLKGLNHGETAINLRAAIRLIVQKNRAHVLVHIEVMDD